MPRPSSYRPVVLAPLDAGINNNVADPMKLPTGVLTNASNARIYFRKLSNAPGYQLFSQGYTHEAKASTNDGVYNAATDDNRVTMAAVPAAVAVGHLFVFAEGTYINQAFRITAIGSTWIDLDTTLAGSESSLSWYCGAPVDILRFDEFYKTDATSWLLAFTEKDIAWWDSNTSSWRRLNEIREDQVSQGTGAYDSGVKDNRINITGALVADELIGLRFEFDSGNQQGRVAEIIDNGITWINIDTVLSGVESGLSWKVCKNYNAVGTPPWSSDTFVPENRFICTNKSDGPLKWGGAGRFTALGGSPPKAAHVRVFKNHVILLDILNEPQRWQSSDIGDSEEWATGEAKTFNIKDTQDFMVGHGVLGDFMVVYKERSVYLVDYIGLPLVFRTRQRINGIGLASSDAVIDMGNYHIITGSDGLIYKFDGLSLSAISEQLGNSLGDLKDPAADSGLKAFFVEETNEVLIAFQSTGGSYVDKAWRYNLLEKVWTGPEELEAGAFGYYREQSDLVINQIDEFINQLDVLINSRSFSSSHPLNIWCSAADQKVYKLAAVYNRNGSSYTLSLEWPILAHLVDDEGNMSIDEDLIKRVGMVSGRIASASSVVVDIFVGVSDDPHPDSFTWHGPYQVSTDPFRVLVNKRGRYYSVRLQYTGTAKVEVENLALYVEPAGHR